MEEYTSYIFQVVCLLIVAVIVLSLCLLGCFKSVKNVRSSESPNEGATDANQVEETSDERDVGGHRGHERALPEIPPTLTRVGTSVDDDEEEDDSIYDIISKGKRTQPCMDNQINVLRTSSSSSSMPGQNKTKTRKKQHPYEKVGGDTDGDSSTYGPPSRDPLYAGIKDVTRKGDGDVNGEQALTTTNQVTISMTSPDIFYVGADDAELPGPSRFSAPFIQNHSPLLPPRNFPDFSNSPEPSNHFSGNEPNGPQEQHQHIPPIQDNLWPSNTFTEQPAESTVNSQSNVAEATTSDDNRVPNYSSVTARESLNNLRKRGQLLLRDNPEEMYDTINYDAIKSPSRLQRASTVLSSDHVYCTTGSDLYAEIATGHSSSRSSMYARVSDVLPRANSNFSLTGQPQASNSVTDPQASRSSAFDDTPSSPSTCVIRSFCNSEFPIYSVVNKTTRPKTYLDSAVSNDTFAASLRKSCIEVAPPFRSVDEFHQPSAGTNQTFLGGSEPTRPKDVRSKLKSEHGYSKIVFNKGNNQKSSESSTIYDKEKYEASIYDRVDEDSLYESVPVDLESRATRVPNQMKVRATEKIRLPWKDKHKKSSEELRRENDVKKIKLLNGYHNDHSVFLSHIGGGLNGLDVTSARKSTNCNSLPKFEWGRHSTSFEKNCQSSTLGKSRFYVTSEILREENDRIPNDRRENQSSDCSSKLPIQSGFKKVPIREHIYELVKDAAYIDEDDDDDGDEDGGMVLESDV